MMDRFTNIFHSSVLILGGASFLALGGCLAQKAELKQTDRELKEAKRDLNAQIQGAKTELDRLVRETQARIREDITQLRERELAAVRNDLEKRAHEGEQLSKNQDELRYLLDRTSKELKEQSNLVAAGRLELKGEQDRFRAEIKAEQERLRSDQERFRNDFRDAVTKDLSKLSGDSTAQVAKLSVRADELAARVTTTENIFKKVSDRLDEQNRELKSSDNRTATQTATLKERLDSQDRALNEVRQALGDFKQALGGLGDKIVNQDKSTTELSGSVSQQTATLAKRVESLSAEVKALTQHVGEVKKGTTGHLDDVNKSVGTVAKALESAGDKFVARLDEQDQRLEQSSKQITWLQDAIKRSEDQSHHLEQVGKQIDWLKEAARRGEEQEQRLEQMGKQIAWLQEVVRRGESRTVEAPAPERPASNGDLQVARPAPARLAPPAESTRSFSSTSPHDTVRERYEQLLGRVREGDLDRAQEGFISFLAEHPTSELAPNARFWLGESYYGKKDYRRAIDAYERVERDYPSSEKVPAALLKKGYAFLALRDSRQAGTVFQYLVTRYPKTNEAGKATEKLAQLKKER